MDVGSATAAAFTVMLLLSLSRPTKSCKKHGCHGARGRIREGRKKYVLRRRTAFVGEGEVMTERYVFHQLLLS